MLLSVVAMSCSPVTVAPPVAPPEPEAPTADGPESDPRLEQPPRLGTVRTFAEVRGLWVVRSTMTSEEEVRTMVADAAAAGFNTLIVQIRGRGDAFYQSALEPRAETIEGSADFDPLALAVREGHLRGMAVHAWVNTHLVWGSATMPESPRHIVNAHPDWLAVPQYLARQLVWVDPHDPRYVAALRQYAADRLDTVEGMFTSPSHPEVRERIFSVWMDLVNRYDLDGIHFDYIRFPSPDFDYSAGALERFQTWVTPRVPAAQLRDLQRRVVSDPLAFATGLPTEWDEFRRTQITSLVREIYHAVKARRPELVVSAAVVADQQTAYGFRFQDWRSWLAEGILDIAVPMAYTPDNGTFRTLVRSARDAAGSRRRVWAGIGAYMDTVGGTLDKIDLARAEDAGGVVLFSYDWAVSDGSRGAADPFLEQVGRERFGS
jgi:uncharacterized lipoprotein YddW (UPF0748 family)